MRQQISRNIFQAMVGILFGYFGTKALLDPGTEAAIWISPFNAKIIESMLSLVAFMYILGVLQVLTATLLIFNKFARFALPLAGVLLLGIIINLGWNELALRDLVILSGVIYLYSSSNSD